MLPHCPGPECFTNGHTLYETTRRRDVAALTLLDDIGPAHADLLRQAGIRSTNQLLEEWRTDEGRRELSRRTGLGREQIDRWVRLADLCRVRGVGTEYAHLLAAAGASTVSELADREPAGLLQEMVERNRTGKFVQRLPSQGKVHHWVEQARNLVQIIGY